MCIRARACVCVCVCVCVKERERESVRVLVGIVGIVVNDRASGDDYDHKIIMRTVCDEFNQYSEVVTQLSERRGYCAACLQENTAYRCKITCCFFFFFFGEETIFFFV